MKRFLSVSLIALLSVIILLSGCTFLGGRDASLEDTASVYYIEGNGSALVEAIVTLPDSSKKAQVKYLIEQLLNPPKGKLSPLCDGTQLNSVTIKDEIAVVDFSDEFEEFDEVRNALAPAAVAKTLCSLDFISGVSILVDGEEAMGSDGKPLGVIMESDVVGEGKAESTKAKVLLYFANDMGDGLSSESREVEVAAASTVEKAIVEELIKGPKNAGSIGIIPTETKVISVETKNGVCFVNLSKEFVNKYQGGTAGETLTVYSVVNSLTELGTIDSVQFLIEGEKRDEFVHMVINEPISRDASIIKK
jgi:germination protein M